MSTCQGLFYAEKLENRVHRTFILTFFFLLLFLKGAFLLIQFKKDFFLNSKKIAYLWLNQYIPAPVNCQLPPRFTVIFINPLIIASVTVKN